MSGFAERPLLPAATNIMETVEAAMVARLQERLPGRVTRIDAFPDRPEDYDFPDREHAAVFVRYDRSDFSPSDGSPRAVYSPRETLVFQAVLLVRALRRADGGPIGAYEALDEIRRALHGRSLAGATPMQPRSRRLEEERGGVWRWVMEFSCAAPAIAESVNEPARAITGYATGD